MRIVSERHISFILIFFGALAWAIGSAFPQSLITAPISESNLTPLTGNTRPEATAENDRGLVPDSLPMRHMLLQLRRPAAKEQVLEQFMAEQQDPASQHYHHWLTASKFGTQYGPSASDIRAVAGWLESHGFEVNANHPSGMTIDFSGTAGEVRAAFHTEIHYIWARGAVHFANMSDPQIPSALASAIVGIASLHNVEPRPQVTKKRNYTYGSCFLGNTCYAVTPPDLATIYNFNPVFASGNTGQNQTIYLIEDTDLYTTADWTTFRSTFGLSGYPAPPVATLHPGNCADPGVNSDDVEAILDAEYASAAAPSATIVMATCADGASFGGLTALQNLIDSATPPAIISMSYGECETDNGAANNAAYNSIFEQGAAEGTSIFVSSGDQEAGGCNYGASYVTAGIGVNGFASTPYNVAVGGTDFSDVYAGTSSSYWNANNTAIYGSALSYIPEVPWNSSCASQLFASYYGFSATYSTSGFCSNNKGESNFLNNVGGSGGPSACATGAPSISISTEYGDIHPVSGGCAPYNKPSWQTGVIGIPNDGARDLPDVSLFAANGAWDHYFVYCYSDTNYGASGCTGAPSNWDGAGGTSFSSPIMAGIQALINQKTGSASGNPNPRLYALAATEYGTGSGTCNSSFGVYQSSWCIFHNVTQGDNDAPCLGTTVGTFNCYLPSGDYGVVSTSNNSYAPAYGTGPGWNFATGLGSVNVANLVANWQSVSKHWWNAGIGGFFGTKGANGILWRDRANGQITTWKLNGVKRVVTGAGQVIGNELTIAGVGDFFASGRSDSILWLNIDSGLITTWQMNGSAKVADGGGPTVASNFTIVGVGDFFASGHSDSILLLDMTTRQITTWKLRGTKVIANGGGQTVADNLVIAGIGDFFKTGRLDSVLLRNTFTGQITTWELNGTTLVATGGGQTQANNWVVAGIGDFFKSGHANCVLWRNISTGQITTWELNGVAQVATGGGQTQPNIWTVAGVGDFFATGGLDSILWRNSQSGEITTWEINGAKTVATGGRQTLP